MKVSKNHQQGDSGVYNVGKAITDDLGWIFRPQESRDYGIDALVEIVTDGETKGQLLALQIKSGKSWLKEKTDSGYIHRNDIEHLDYWSNYPIPVIVTLHDPCDNKIYWQIINEQTVTKLDAGWKITVPFQNQLNSECKNNLHRFCDFTLSQKSYSISFFKDMSHGAAKRYSSSILLNNNLSKGEMLQLANSLTNELKERNYCRNEIVKKRWNKEPASVVWLYFYNNYEDLKNNNWICRSQWISKELDERFAPLKENGIHIGDELVLIWSNLYHTFLEIYKDEMTKEDFIDIMAEVIEVSNRLSSYIKALFSKYKSSRISNEKFEKEIKKKFPEIELLNERINFRNNPPLECKDIDQLLSQIVCSVDNIRIVFENYWNKKNTIQNRDYLINMYLETYERDFKKYEYERDKL